MTITFRGVTANPADNAALSDATGNITLATGSGVASQMQQGDLMLALVVQRDGNPTLTVGTAGGQSWSSQTMNSPGASVSAQLFWCRYEPPWTADPVFNSTANFGGAITLIPMVFTPTHPFNKWAVDVTQAIGNATPSTPFDVTATGQTPTASTSVVTMAYWFLTNSTATTWSLQTAGWTNPNGETQWRNTQGTDISVSAAYKIQSSAAATGNVTNRQATATGITTYWGIITFREIQAAPTRTLLGVG